MRTWFGIWIVASIAWMAGVGYGCLRTWPHVSLDLNATDSGVRAAYEAAVFSHVVWYGVIAIGVPIVMMIIGRVFLRR